MYAFSLIRTEVFTFVLCLAPRSTLYRSAEYGALMRDLPDAMSGFRCGSSVLTTPMNLDCGTS